MPTPLKYMSKIQIIYNIIKENLNLEINDPSYCFMASNQWNNSYEFNTLALKEWSVESCVYIETGLR